MNRIRVLVEGQTEETFVNDILCPHLNKMEVYPHASLIRKKGGSFAYQRVQKEIVNTLKEDASLVCTMSVDFYALPKDWPGRDAANDKKKYLEKAETVEKALSVDICSQLGTSFNPARFIPYVQMHEYEALLFSDTGAWADGAVSVQLEKIRQSFSCPEEINDNYNTCPSRRIISIFNKYDKRIDGIIAAKKISLTKMRAECPHFNEWITKLEMLGRR